jgi:hypothetical protein
MLIIRLVSCTTAPETCKTRGELRGMELLRPSECALSTIFLLFLIDRDLTHLEFGRGIDLRGEFLILRIAWLGGVS